MAKKKKPSHKQQSLAQKWLSQKRQSLSTCSRDFVVYDKDGETVLYGPDTVYACVNWQNAQGADFKANAGSIVSKDLRDAKVSQTRSNGSCEDCDPFSYGHPCDCISKKLPRAWRPRDLWT